MKIVGVGFRPKDEELVDFYLKHKLLGDDPSVLVMPDIELCDVEPWEVPAMLEKSVLRFGDPEWFFFSPVDFKYSNSKRVNRTTKCGFWKPTGNDRDVKGWDTTTVIGSKKTLVFHQGRASKGVKTNWVIHEYHASTLNENQRTFVLCRLIKKPGNTTEGGTDALISEKGESSISMVSNYENQGVAYTGMKTIFPETDQSDTCFPSRQQSLIGIDEQEETFYPNYPLINVYFRNENINQILYQQKEMISQQKEMVSQQKEMVSQQTEMVSQQTEMVSQQTEMVSQQTEMVSQQTDMVSQQTKMVIPSQQTEIDSQQTEIVSQPMHISFESIISEEDEFFTSILTIDEEITQDPFQPLHISLESIVSKEDEFLTSILSFDEEITQIPDREITQISSEPIQFPSEPIYCEDYNYPDAKVIFKDYKIEDISIMYDEYSNLNNYHASKRFKT
ncbi:unnamed protein product [Sphenostylis stenocarpa]|uniref:NAC domain-containing protein n=1 Tax=Sphenostylis stenocarpa TaxID=92480 RepID=A0AA86T4I5_9FABA|nr:unnamed protein product [Sphenostylis stenocarpa]